MACENGHQNSYAAQEVTYTCMTHTSALFLRSLWSECTRVGSIWLRTRYYLIQFHLIGRRSPGSRGTWWLFRRLLGSWENVRPFILRLPFFFLKWRLARAHSFHSLCQDQSTVAQRAESTLAGCSLTSCVWTHFRIGSHTMPGQRHSQPSPTSLGRMCMHV